MPIDRNSAQYITGAIYKPTQTSAPGVWDLDDQANNIAKNLWPLPPQAVQRSLRFNVADNAYLSRTPAVAGNRRTWTWSGWIKRGLLGSVRTLISSNGTNDNTLFQFEFNGDALRLAGSATQWAVTTSLYRDPSAWYHIILATDTTQATASDRFKIYVNGVLVTSYSATSYPSQNADLGINDTRAQYIGEYWNTSPSFDGYMAEINFIDGQALTPASFGEIDVQTGVWTPKRYTGTYGTNGFRLSFANNSSTTALGYDSSGQGNNWTANNFSVTPGSDNDSLVDVPSLYGTDTGLGGEVLGNYPTLNPINNSSSSPTLSNGNLTIQGNTTSYQASPSTMAFPSTGKWYLECTLDIRSIAGQNQQFTIGDIVRADGTNLANGYTIYALYTSLEYFHGTTAVIPTNLGIASATGDIIKFAYDADTGKFWSGVNNTWFLSGNPAAGSSPIYTFSTIVTRLFQAVVWGTSGKTSINFGQRPFSYPAPTGYKALCTTNLPAPAIGQTSSNQADNHFAAVTYTGNGGTQTISTLDFQPDLVWIKRRDSNWSHAVYDSIRGAGSLKALSTNATDAEGVFNADTTYGYLSSFNNNGFTVVNGSTGGYTNFNNATYVAWCWKKSRAAGLDVVTATANASAVVTYNHSLGVAPAFVISKSRSAAVPWLVYHKSLGVNQYLLLNTLDAATTLNGVYSSSLSQFSITSQTANASYVAYMFAEIPGFSAFGSYTGNGSTDGPFIYLGFRPAWIMIKRSDAIENWNLYDNKRNPYNVADLELYPNLSNSEGTTADRDFLSNGFKIRSSNAGRNASGSTYIYAAFAETPARLSTAR